MSALVAIFFLGGFVSGGALIFSIKTIFVVFLFIWVRAAFPRYRYDQLMRLGWKVFLPLSLGWVVFSSGFILGLYNLF